MKKIAFFGLLFIFVLFQPSCDELGPDINLSGGGTTGGGDTQERNILVEEFTGVHCANCPEGSVIIESLKGTYGDRLIPVSIHAGFFANPYADSQYDFRTPEGEAIDAYLGTAAAWPAAAIDRTIFDGETSIITGKNVWPGYIAIDASTTTPVELNITKSFTAASRLLEVTVDLNFVETVTDNLLISVMVLENGIIDIQKSLTETIPDYEHKHVLRGMLTNATGDSYTGSSSLSDTGSQSFSMTLPTEWVEGNCEIVAFIHSADTKKVFQANSAHLVD